MDNAIWQGTRPSRRSLGMAAVLAVLIGVVAFAPVWLRHGGAYMDYGDYFLQYVPFVKELKRMLASGSLSWSWNSFLGDGFIGAYSFYTVFNPFAWILVLFPDGYLLHGAMLVTLLKLVVCMLGAMWYIRRFCKKDATALLGALLYTFSGFTLVNTHFYFFLDVIALFPFVLYGLERLIWEGKSMGYVLSLALHGVINYYFFVSTVLLIVLYVLFRLELYKPSAWRVQWKRVCRIAGDSILGTGLAGVALWPSFYAILGSGKATQTIGTELQWMYWPQKILEHLRTLLAPIESGRYHAFYDSSVWSSTAVYLPVFGACFVLQWCLRKKDWLKKICVALLVCYFVPILNGMFHLLSSTSYTRWLYGMALLFALVTAVSVEEEGNKKRPTWVTALAAGLVLVPTAVYVLYELGFPVLNRFASVCTTEYFMGYSALIVMLGLTAVNYGALWFLSWRKPWTIKGTIWLVAAACALNYAVYNELNYDFHATEYSNQYYYEKAMVEGSESTDETFVYRIDHPGQIANYGLFQNRPSVNYYNSLQNPGSSALAQAVGIGEDQKDTILVTPSVGGEYTDALLSVKYYYDYDGSGTVPESFRYAKTENGVDIYENEAYIPMGFVYNAYALEERLTELQPEERARLLLHALVIPEAQEEQVRQYLTLASEPVATGSLTEVAAQRREGACSYFSGNTAGFSAEITLEKENIVFFSIPNDSGWEITVNGETARVLSVNYGLLGICCQAGRNVISASYHTPGLAEGVVCSLACLTVWLLVELCKKRGRKVLLASERREYGEKVHKAE